MRPLENRPHRQGVLLTAWHSNLRRQSRIVTLGTATPLARPRLRSVPLDEVLAARLFVREKRRKLQRLIGRLAQSLKIPHHLQERSCSWAEPYWSVPRSAGLRSVTPRERASVDTTERTRRRRPSRRRSVTRS